jgi:hypothetical protein
MQTQAFTRLSATSGPNGEDPTGFVEYLISPTVSDYGPVTCLAVSGNSATLNYESPFSLGGPIVTVQVVDDDPDTVVVLGIGRAATDCSPSSAPFVLPLTSGDIKVVDAPPPPTTRRQCRHGGWKRFGFKHKRQCIAFVNHARWGTG